MKLLPFCRKRWTRCSFRVQVLVDKVMLIFSTRLDKVLGHPGQDRSIWDQRSTRQNLMRISSTTGTKRFGPATATENLAIFTCSTFWHHLPFLFRVKQTMQQYLKEVMAV